MTELDADPTRKKEIEEGEGYRIERGEFGEIVRAIINSS